MNTVINLHGRRNHPDYDPALNPNVVYLGNRQWWGAGRLLDGHPLGNPFRVKKYGREESLRLYAEWLPTVQELDRLLEQLRGKTLACWCVEPGRDIGCHALIVVQAIAERWAP